MGELTGGAVREIHRAYVAVLLSGSKKAKAKAKAARTAAWDLNDRLNGQVYGVDGVRNLFVLLEAFRTAAGEFVEVAEQELT